MKLLGTHASPYARKVRLVLLEKNLPHEFLPQVLQEPDSLALQVNPLGRVPALILDDGFCLFDSAVISDYLDGLNAQPTLIPAEARWRVKRWEALADGVMDSAVVMRMEKTRPVEQQNPKVFELHNTAIHKALSFAAEHLADRAWLEGDSLTLADLALASALIYLDFRLPECNWRSHANLAAWFEKIRQRPSVVASLQEV